jgi:hypothetical protein
VRIDTAQAEVLATNREARVDRVITRLTPNGEELREAIGEVFSDDPSLPWSDVLDDLADAAEVDDTDIDEAEGC